MNTATRSLSECLDSVDTDAGRQRAQAYLQAQPFPHYEAHSLRNSLIIRIDTDGSRTVGRFVNREFRAARDKRK